MARFRGCPKTAKLFELVVLDFYLFAFFHIFRKFFFLLEASHFYSFFPPGVFEANILDCHIALVPIIPWLYKCTLGVGYQEKKSSHF